MSILLHELLSRWAEEAEFPDPKNRFSRHPFPSGIIWNKDDFERFSKIQAKLDLVTSGSDEAWMESDSSKEHLVLVHGELEGEDKDLLARLVHWMKHGNQRIRRD